MYSVEHHEWKLKHVRDYEEAGMGFCHGAKFYPYDDDLVAISYKPAYCIYFKSLSTGSIKLKIDCKPLLPKDVCFPAVDKIIVTYCERFPSKRPGIYYDVDVKYYSFSLTSATSTLLDHVKIEKCHTDSCVFSDGKLYFTGGVDNIVIVYKLENNKLTFDRKITGFSFPHGIDLRDGVLAVTNYGTNSVSIQRV